jgi:hypothetical protein
MFIPMKLWITVRAEGRKYLARAFGSIQLARRATWSAKAYADTKDQALVRLLKSLPDEMERAVVQYNYRHNYRGELELRAETLPHRATRFEAAVAATFRLHAAMLFHGVNSEQAEKERETLDLLHSHEVSAEMHAACGYSTTEALTQEQRLSLDALSTMLNYYAIWNNIPSRDF